MLNGPVRFMGVQGLQLEESFEKRSEMLRVVNGFIRPASLTLIGLLTDADRKLAPS